MQIKCIAIDDEPLALELIREFADRFPALKLLYVFDDAISAASYLSNNTVDLLFIDINMPDITGIELVRSLKQKPMIIFTTAHKKFALDGFELDAVDYLLKPIEFERFSRAVNKAVDYYEFKNAVKLKSDQALFVRSEYQLIRINLDDIEYVESLEDYLKIHLVTGKPVMTLMTLKAILEKLPADRFKRIHRSYVIAVEKVRSVLNKKVRLQTIELPVGESYAEFMNEWKKR